MAKLTDDVRAYFSALGTRGGKRAAAGMTAAERKARATKASKAAAVARAKKKQTKSRWTKPIDYSDIPAMTDEQLASMRRVGPGGVLGRAARMQKKRAKP